MAFGAGLQGDRPRKSTCLNDVLIPSTYILNMSMNLHFLNISVRYVDQIKQFHQIPMPFDRTTPFNELPLLPPAGDIETKAILRKAISANAALAELRGLGRQIPNQAILIRALGLQEAKLSSEIENIVTTNDALYRAVSEIEGKVDQSTKEVLYYQDALWHGYEAIKKRSLLTTNLFIELAGIIKQIPNFSIRQLPGTKLANQANGEVIYTPPEGETIIRDKLANLEHFIHEESSLDPLVKLAVMHYQFEAIHPFPDGNGRTGRIINILYLILAGLLETPVLYLSRYIIENRSQYYTLLSDVTETQNWEPWILYVLDAVEQTAKSTRDKILAIHELMEDFGSQVKSQRPKIYSKDLIEALFRQPYVRITFLEQAGVAKRQTASQYLKEVESLGLLRSVRLGREVYYVNQPLVDLLAK
jgi:Fic family protein